MKIALVGNPNSGKSTLFNALTGLNQKTGNFPGVTVERHSGKCNLTEKKFAEIIDLPGTYSLYPKSDDERVVFHILSNRKDEDYPDAVVVIVNASNLKRNLLLCTQVMDLGIPTVLCLNMIDIAGKDGLMIDEKKLSAELGIPVVKMNARKEIGISELKKILAEKFSFSPMEMYPVLGKIKFAAEEIKNKYNLPSAYLGYHAILQSENFPFLNGNFRNDVQKIISSLNVSPAKLQGEEAVARYRLIDEIVKDIITEKKSDKKSFEAKVDRILTHRVLGYIIFAFIMILVFQAIFNWAVYPMGWIENGFSLLGNFLATHLPKGPLNDLLVNGILAGLSGVVIFIPQIAFLFFFISLLEDTGYMARVIFLMDKIMRKFGLNGKSVVPLIGGMACAVPSIMAARNIENRKDRLITIMVTPLMSCSARLPVYTLLIAMFVPDKNFLGFFNLKGLVLMGMYALGFFAALGSAFVMKLVLKAKEKSFFIYELPTYKMPKWKSVGMNMMNKSKSFVWNAGKVIVAISIILWFLASFAPGKKFDEIEKKYSSSEFQNLPAKEIQLQKSSEKLEASYAGAIGRFIEPAVQPLGFNWKIGIALITSFAAREVFVGTMATLYSVDGDMQVSMPHVREKMKSEINPQTGKPVYTGAVALSLMIFYAFAMQCMSTVATVKTETRSWKWAIIMIVYMTGLAYVSSFIVYRILV